MMLTARKKYELGDRIGAILGAEDDNKVVKFLGFGVYDGEHIPPPDVGGFNIGAPNPRLKLDSGKVAWGCECWWGSEAGLKRQLDLWKTAGYTIVDTDIDAAREAAKQ
jgi:hypothetical protein